MSSVKIIRLLSGEEIVGEISAETVHEIHISKPAMIQLVPSQSGGIGVTLFPFGAYAAKDVFEFKRQHIVTTFEPSKELYNNYNKLFGSGLVVAGPTLLKENVLPFKGN